MQIFYFMFISPVAAYTLGSGVLPCALVNVSLFKAASSNQILNSCIYQNIVQPCV